MFQITQPGASLWNNPTTTNFAIIYWSLSISLNIILTLLLVGRLLYMSHNARRSLGDEHAATYISVAAMLVESATPYAVTSLIFIITYARNSNVQNLVLPVLSQIMVRRSSPVSASGYSSSSADAGDPCAFHSVSAPRSSSCEWRQDAR